MYKFVSFLRGINVGGNKKVPMTDLKKIFEKLGFSGIKTFLASGNILFEAQGENPEDHIKKIVPALERAYKFEIPLTIIPFGKIEKLIEQDPFKRINVTAMTRLYVTFLWRKSKSKLKIPYKSSDGGFSIILEQDNMLLSVLDLDKNQTTDAMNVLDKEFGKGITTRNWNTILKIGNG